MNDRMKAMAGSRENAARAWLTAALLPDGRYRLEIFSERTPTMIGPSMFWATVMEGFGHDFASARADLLKRITERRLPPKIAQFGDKSIRRAAGFKV